MGATEEPELPTVELERLHDKGVDVELVEIQPHAEGVLHWRGQLVILYIQEQSGGGSETTGYRFHIAECHTITRMRAGGRGGRYRITSRTDGLFPVATGFRGSIRLIPLRVCRNCLWRLDWDGFRSASTPKSNKIVKDFKIEEFEATYQNRRKPAPAPPPVGVGPGGPLAANHQVPPGPTDAESWAWSITDAQFRQAALHLQRHGRIDESELARMVEGPRRARRFANSLEEWFQSAPFQVEARYANNVKVYLKRPR